MTKQQRDLFLTELRLSGNLTFACASAGVSRAGAIAERLRDPSFERSWRICQVDAREFAEARAAKNRADFGVHSIR